MKLPLILIDDPRENDLIDLRRLLSGRGRWALAGIVEPVERSDADVAQANESGAGIASASAVTAGAPVPRLSYRLLPAREKNGRAAPVFEASNAVSAILAVATPPFVVVAFVSNGTLPVIEALHADDRTRSLLKLGITGVRLDRNYNLARKLVYDSKLSYHEHSMALDQVLIRRLRTMLLTGLQAPESTGSAAQGMHVGGTEKMAPAPPATPAAKPAAATPAGAPAAAEEPS